MGGLVGAWVRAWGLRVGAFGGRVGRMNAIATGAPTGSAGHSSWMFGNGEFIAAAHHTHAASSIQESAAVLPLIGLHRRARRASNAGSIASLHYSDAS